MTAADLTLVVGATGLLGTEVVRHLCQKRRAVRAVVRPGSSWTRASQPLRAAEVVVADLKNMASLRSACSGVTAVISTATAMRSRREGDSVESVDEQGQFALLEAAEREGVRHFVFVSFPELPVECALQRSKRKVERALLTSALRSTVLQATNFREIWLSSAVGFDPAHGKARILGDGSRAVSWISVRDVARYAVAAAEADGPAGRTLRLGGPDPLSPLDVVRIFEELGAPRVALDFVPEAELEAQVASARNAIEEARAALSLATARGLVADPKAAAHVRSWQLLNVRNYAFCLLKQANI
jgi:uncharacterized protein YbjT (DUF2867 family)